MSADEPSSGAAISAPGENQSPASLLLAGEIYYTDEELIKAERSRLIELDRART